MGFMQITEVAAVIIGIASASAAGILWNTVRAYKENSDALRTRIESLEDETKLCNANHIENIAKIKELQGQVDAFKDIPLKEIAHTQREILQTQKEILQFVKQIKEQ